MTTEVTEVFRFATVRGIQRASSESLKGKVIYCSNPNPEKPLIQDHKEAIVDASKFFDSVEMVKDLRNLDLPIGLLDTWLLDHNDKVSPMEIRGKISALINNISLEDLVVSPEYKKSRLDISTSLARAAILNPGGPETYELERIRTMLVRAMHIFGLLEEIVKEGTIIKSSEDVFAFLAFATIVLPAGFPRPAGALARPPAMADLKVVKQKVVKYEMGDIAHIENVLKGESKTRVHRRKDIRQETLTTENERETNEERELQTSEQFQMQQEASKVVSDDMHFETGATITASYGPTVSATVTAGFEMNHAQEESSRTATNFARSVMERSSNRVRERTLSRRTVQTTNEVEETNTHEIYNRDGKGHTIGIYRYVDKIYEAQIYNYGQRLLLEFIVPEPASFIRQLLSKPFDIDMKLPDFPEVTEVPVGGPPTKRPLKPDDIQPENYLDWVAKYFAQDINPPPAKEIWIPIAWEEKAQPDTGITPEMPGRKIYKTDKSADIPEGYIAKVAKGAIGVSDYLSNVMISIGDIIVPLSKPTGITYGGEVFSFAQDITDSPTGKIPIGLIIENAWGYTITIQIKCELRNEGFQKWQLETFSQIMRAYFELKSLYNQKVAAAEIQRGVSIKGRNTDENRKTERTELKKHVIAMLEKHYFNKSPVDGEAINTEVDPPEINFEVAQKERNFVQWFEQAFEWQNLTYVFYPYYWSNKTRWKVDALAQDSDPLFNAFLRAGAARVVVPVRPRFELAMGLYLATGIIWNGNHAPQVGDDLFVSAIQEIQEQQNAPLDGTPEGKPWQFKLPTPLIILQEKGEL